jgi:hypothetical protein
VLDLVDATILALDAGETEVVDEGEDSASSRNVSDGGRPARW